MKPKPKAFRRWRTILLHSASGAGKTTVAATGPKPMILDSNFGLSSIEGRPGFEHVRDVPIGTLGSLDRAYDNLTGTGKRDWRPPKFQTIVLDHLDDIQGLVLDDLTAKVAARDERRMVDDPGQKEYGVMGNRLRRYIRQLKRLPAHKILICSTRPDPDTGQLRPNLVGALRDQLGYFCDEIAFLRIRKDGTRMMHFEPSEKWVAKTRAWWLPRRRFVVKLDDTQFFTRLFRTIAAGPAGATPERGAEE